MIVSRGRYLREVFFRYQAQIMMTVIGLSMIVLGILDTPLISSYYTIAENARLPSQEYGGGLVLIVFGILGIISTFKIRGPFAGGLMTLGIVIHFMIFIAILFPDPTVVDPSTVDTSTLDMSGDMDSGSDDYYFSEDEGGDDEDEGGTANYIIRMIFYLLEVFIGFFAIKMIMGSTHNTKRVIVVELVFIAVFLLALFINIHHKMTLYDALTDLNDYHASIILMSISVICLSLGDAKYISPTKRLRLNVLALETTTVTFGEMYMMRDSLKALLDENRTQWSDSPEPEIDKELEIILYNNLRRERLVIRQWADDGAVTGTFKPRDLEVHLYRYLNFPIMHISCPGGADTCGRVRMYGREGFFVDILVRDHHIRKYRSAREMWNPVLKLKDRIIPPKEQAAEESAEEQ